ncbi:MAG: TIGR03545 family protein [Planctomycetota bacterium]
MIRWRFLFTRLVVVASIVMLLCLGMGPLTQYVTIAGLQSATGAKADIRRTRVGFFPPSVQFKNVSIADPRDDKEFRDALTAESVQLVIDGDALLRRRWVVDRARVTGLEVGTHRDTSGHLETQPSTKNAGTSQLARWLSAAGNDLADRAESLGQNLQTVQAGKDIRQEWENEYERLLAEVTGLEQRVRDIRDRAQGIDNPLRDWPELERTLEEARAVRETLLALRRTIDELPEQMQTDLARLEQARQADLATLDQFVPGDLEDSKNFGVDLVSGEVRRQLERLRSYVDNSRTLANYTVVAPESIRIRGEDYDFLGDARRPGILIRQCELSGLLRASGKTYTLTGIMENMTPETQRLRQPTTARLKLEGPETVLVDYVRDRRNTSVDRLTLHWPEMRAESIRVSGGDQIDVAIAGGRRELWVQLDTRGGEGAHSDEEYLSGRLVSKQVGVAMRVDLHGTLAQTDFAVAINESLADVDRVEVDAAFEGTWDDLRLRLNTNVGDSFVDAARSAVGQQIASSQKHLSDKINTAHREQMLVLREWMTKQQTEVQNLIAKTDAEIEAMSQKVLAEVGGADKYLGKLRTSFGKSLR